MKKSTLFITLLVFISFSEKIRIGIALRPYYSFVANIVEDRAEIVHMTAGKDPHAYSIIPKDVARAKTMDVVVLNGVGHDDFALDILKATGKKDKIPVIYANDDVAMIPQATGSKVLNSHTFVSISTSIVQIYHIANKLAEADPANGDFYKKNASTYVRKLRLMKHEYIEKILSISDEDIKCATMHGGYSYLLQEFGITIDEVLQPAHGLNPTAAQLKKIIQKIKDKSIDVIFSEEDYPGDFIKVIQDETNIVVVPLSHLSKGSYTKGNFEEGMKFNMEQLLKAVQRRKDGQ